MGLKSSGGPINGCDGCKVLEPISNGVINLLRVGFNTGFCVKARGRCSSPSAGPITRRLRLPRPSYLAYVACKVRENNLRGYLNYRRGHLYNVGTEDTGLNWISPPGIQARILSKATGRCQIQPRWTSRVLHWILQSARCWLLLLLASWLDIWTRD